jgi:hypothetical protein
MAVTLDLTIVAGLSYARRFRIVGGAAVWPTLADFSVLSQVRVGNNSRSTLKTDLTPFMTPSYDAEDIVIDFALDGNQSKTVHGGYYDVVIADANDPNARGLVILSGRLQVNQLVTEVTYA